MAPNESNNCFKCKKNINLRTSKYLICDGECKKKWHTKCLELSDEKIGELLKNTQIPWFCVLCSKKVSQRRLTMGSNETSQHTPTTPNVFNFENSNDEINNHNGITLEMIYQEVKSIKINQETFQRSIKNLEKTMQDYKIIMDKLTQENIDLRNENTNLNKKINNIEYNIDTKEQQKLENNLVINGVY